MDFTTTITVDRTPQEAFAAVTDVRGWWSETIDGDTAHVGDVFVFTVPGIHRCTMTLTEVVPGRRIVWAVSDSYLSFIQDKTEWDGTSIVFDITGTDGRTEIRFTHVGLAPAAECYTICADAWGTYITSSLRDLILTGQGDPIRRTSSFASEISKHQAAKARS